MACPSLLRSSTSSFYGQFPIAVSPPRLSFGNPRNAGAVVPVKAAEVVLVEKSESEKVSRLKTTYLERIIPKLKEEFSYKNIHEVNKATILYFILILHINFFNSILCSWIGAFLGLKSLVFSLDECHWVRALGSR